MGRIKSVTHYANASHPSPRRRIPLSDAIDTVWVHRAEAEHVTHTS